MQRDVDIENDIHQWERKALVGVLGLLVVCFTAWAGVVFNSGQDVVHELRATREENAQYRLLMERRVTLLEKQTEILSQRQEWVIRNMMSQHQNSTTVPP
jgi:hypothetical protein